MLDYAVMCAVCALLRVDGSGTAVQTCVPDPIQATIRFYNKRLSADPYDFISANALAEAHVARGRRTGDLKDFQAAESEYRRSLRITRSGNDGALIGLAAALASQHRFAEARELLNPLLKECAIPLVWAVAGDIAFELGEYESAKQCYEQYANARPGLASWSRLAKSETLFGHVENARMLWEKCCALPMGSDPEPLAWAWVMNGELFLRAGLIDQAQARFMQALQVMPGYVLALEHLAETYEIKGEDERALQLLDSAMLQGVHADLLYRRAEILKRQRDSVQASELRGAAVALLKEELVSGDVGHRRVLANMLLNEPDESLRALELACAEANDRSDIGSDILFARVLHAKGKVNEAADRAERAVRYGSFEPGILNDAARILESAGRHERANTVREVLSSHVKALRAAL